MIDMAIEYVKSFGYLNDARYAENFIRSRQNSKSRKEIQAALLQKGVSSELIGQAMELCYEDGDEEAAIRSILRKKKLIPVLLKSGKNSGSTRIWREKDFVMRLSVK